MAGMLRSRGSTLRTALDPMGSNVGKTGEHNLMVGRVCILLCLALAKRIWWCMEQPKGSLLEGHVLFQAFLKLKHVLVSRTTCSLGWFGADTLKPIWIYSSTWDLEAAKRSIFTVGIHPHWHRKIQIWRWIILEPKRSLHFETYSNGCMSNITGNQNTVLWVITLCE